MPKINSFAKALIALKNNFSFDDPHCKNPIKAFIRQASETSNHHSSVHFVSKELISLYPNLAYEGKSKYQMYCNKEFKHEHIVPVEVIFNMIKNDTNITEIKISEILRNFSLRATILKSENEKLDKIYRSKMPDEFYKSDDPLYFDALARYKKLEIKLVPRKEVIWLMSIS